MIDNEFERIFKIALDFAEISFKHRGIRYFYIRRNIATQNKYWKYFKKIDEWASSGKIKLPDYIELQFKSWMWKNVNILPSQLTCERALKVWGEYKKNNDQNITDEGRDNSEYILHSFIGKVKLETDREEFFNRFIKDDGEFDIDFYLTFKQTTNDFIYKVIMNMSSEIFIEFLNDNIKMERDIVRDKIKSIEDSFLQDNEKKIYLREIKKKYKIFKMVLSEMIEYKNNLKGIK